MKKLIDVIPPRKNQKREIKLSINQSSDSVRPQKRSLFFLFIPIFVLIITSFFLYFYLPRVKIEIWPKREKLSFETEFKINQNVNGKLLKTEEVVSQEFLATEKFIKEIRAEGMVRLFNNHSAEAVVLREGTRFVSANGKLFRSPNRIVIPGRRGQGVPGEIDIRIVADQPGKEFNIGPTIFSIPGLQGTAMFFEVTARSFEPMTGGLTTEAIRVGQRDLEVAERDLEAKTKELCLSNFRNQILPGFDFLAEAVEIKIQEKKSSVEVGAEKERFNFEIRFNCRALAFETKEVEAIAKNFIQERLPQAKAIIPASLKIDKSVIQQDLNLGTAFLLLRLTADVYQPIDLVRLEKELIEKSLAETYLFLRNLKEVERVNVNFWPFWVRSVPRELERIKIKIIY